MKILFYEVRHFSPNFHEFTGSKTIFAKKNREKKNCQNPFQAIVRLKKEKEKWHGPLSHWCREVKTLVVRPLKKNTFFMCVFPKVYFTCYNRQMCRGGGPVRAVRGARRGRRG